MAEPVVEISWRNYAHGKEYTVSCLTQTDSGLCGWWDVVFTPEEAIEVKNDHVKWHEGGMPE